MITVRIEHRRSDKANKDFEYTAYERLFISEDGSYFECDTDNPTQIIYYPYVRDGVSPRISVTGDFIPSDGMIYDTNDDEDYNIVFTVDYDPPSKPSNPGGGSGGNNPNTPSNPSNPSTATIRYFFKNSGDPADYTTGYVGDGNYTKTISHYGLSLVAGSTTTRNLTYYTDSDQSATGSYSIESPRSGYLLYSVVSSPELGQEDYKNVDYDIKAYCFEAPTITVAYTSTPDTLFGNPATIYVRPNAYGSVGSFYADWGMIGGMVVTTNFKVNSGYKFLNWTIKKGGTTETKTGNEYQYNVNTFDDVTITANFERLPAVTTQIYPVGTGTTNPTVGTITPTGTNYQITLNATPNDGYVFKNWSKSGTNLSEYDSYTYKASKGENVIITANFEKIPDPNSEDVEVSTGYENKMITNNELEEVSLYVFNKNGLDSSKCPTYSHISNANYNYNIISIKNNNGYESNQCVKYSDITISGINAKITVYNRTAWGFACPVVYLGVKNDNTVSYHSNGKYNGAVLAWNDRTFTIPISCNASSGNWYSNSGSNKLYVKVDGSSWDSSRRIEIEINGTKYSSSKELKIEEQSTINLNTFLRNNYIIKVWVYPT